MEANQLTTPESKSAEAALLGSMIVDPQTIPTAAEVTDEMFYYPEHRTLSRLIRRIYDRNKGQGVDGLLVRNELETSGQIEQCGGVEYLRSMLESVPTTVNVNYYANIVRCKALRREAISVGRTIIERAFTAEVDDEEAILDFVTEPMSVVTKTFVPAGRNSGTDMFSMLVEAFEQIENPVACRVRSPWWSLSRHVPGFKPGQMIVVAGRPGMGKTAFTLNLALKACAEGANVLFITFEMTRVEMMNRAVSAISNVPMWKFDHADRDMTLDDHAAMVQARNILSAFKLRVYDRTPPTPLAVKNACRARHRQERLDAIVVDYLQRMNTGGGKKATRDWEVTAISNELKNMALELGVPVFVLSQMNRASEGRENKRPRMSDLRDSGSIEQDADVILGLYREDEYSDDDCTIQGLSEVIVLKNRNGAAHKTAYLQFWPGTMTFHDRAVDSEHTGEETHENNDSNV